MSALYRLGIGFYFLFLRIAALFHPKARLFVHGRRQLLANIRYALIDERRARIWMHCASLGEFEQGRPVLEALRRQYPHLAIVLTFFSPSGYEVRKDYEGADYVFYLPEDGRRNAARFLRLVQPKLVLFVKYDLWYFFLREIARLDIPALLFSAAFRPQQGFFKWYGVIQRRMLRCFRHLFVQDMASVQLLNRIGIEHATVAGDTRFDRVVAAAGTDIPLPDEARDFCRDGAPVLVAGSTWQEDEIFLEKVWLRLPEEWKIILVPHEVHETHLETIEKLFGTQTVRWSQYRAGSTQRVLLVDRVGLLLQLYRCGRVAWIGGGLGKDGVHNVLEAAVRGIPCAWGPVYDKYIEARELLQAGGALVAAQPESFLAAIETWQARPGEYAAAGKAAYNYVHSHSGATDKIMAYLLAKNWLTIS